MAVDRSGVNNSFYGKKHSLDSKQKMRMARLGKRLTEEQKMNFKGKHTGERSPWWKGDNTSYRSLHRWVERWLGKPQECVFCGKTRLEGKLQWASISHHARRDLEDYISLCVKCHVNYDRKERVVS